MSLTPQTFDEADIKGKLRKIVPAVKAAADKLDETKKTQLEKAADAFETKLAMLPDHVQWAQNAATGIQALRKALAAANAELTDKQELYN